MRPAENLTYAPRLLHRADFPLLVRLPTLALAALLLPERHWPEFTRRWAKIRRAQRRQTRQRVAQIENAAAGRDLGRSAEAVHNELVANGYLEEMQLLRARLPGGWRPDIRLDGADQVDAALQEGKGAILWVFPASFYPLVSKIAFHRAGYPVTHLTSVEHGFSRSRLGVRLLNPLQYRLEQRYLDECLVIGRGGAQSSLTFLARRLRENRLISITVGAYHTSRVNRVRFMNGAIKLPSGPLYLSQHSDAPLFPVFTAREADGGFAVTIQNPITFPEGRKASDAVEGLLETYASRLEAFALQHPDQFPWTNVKLDADDADNAD